MASLSLSDMNVKIKSSSLERNLNTAIGDKGFSILDFYNFLDEGIDSYLAESEHLFGPFSKSFAEWHLRSLVHVASKQKGLWEKESLE
nr:hypothetical protein CFP56_62018 [Quercus suber]